jgi:hypothetical protein
MHRRAPLEVSWGGGAPGQGDLTDHQVQGLIAQRCNCVISPDLAAIALRSPPRQRAARVVRLIRRAAALPRTT